MPIDKSKYPSNWAAISQRIRFERANGVCEGSPKYPDCKAKHGHPHPVTKSKVILTVAHLDHNPMNNAPNNLRAMCQRCHLTYDAKNNAKKAKITRLKKKKQSNIT